MQKSNNFKGGYKGTGGGFKSGGYKGGYKGGSGGYKGNNYNRDGYRPRYQGPDKNYFIRAESVLVIGADGSNIGEMKTIDAINLAKSQGLDLVEVSTNASPPVCRIINFSKFLYEQKKKKKKSKQASAKELKEFRFSAVIEQHDIDIRVKRAKEFLSKGHNVRVFIQKKGRQTREQVSAMMSRLLTYFTDYSTIEPEPKFEGNRISITYKPDGKTKNKQNSDQKSPQDQPKGQPQGKNDD